MMKIFTTVGIFVFMLFNQGFNYLDHSPYCTFYLNRDKIYDSRQHGLSIENIHEINYSDIAITHKDSLFIHYRTDTQEDNENFLIILNSKNDTVLLVQSEGRRANYSLDITKWSRLKRQLPVTFNYSFRSAALIGFPRTPLFKLK